MSPLEYLGAALESWPSYIALVALFVALHIILIRRWVVGVFDPLFVLLLANAFSWSIVWFMYLQGDIPPAYVVSFSVAELALYAGVWAGRPSRVRPITTWAKGGERRLVALILGLTAFVHVASNLSIWRIAGIPLFRDSRLGAFEGSGGLGILERLADSSALIAIFAAVYLLVHARDSRRSFALLSFLAWYLCATALSGSKGAFLTIGQYALSIVYVHTSLRTAQGSFWGGASGKLLLAVSAIFAIGVLIVQQAGEGGDLTSAVVALVFRVVSFGDVFIFAYPDATIESIKGDNALVGMFGGFLSTFRLFPQDAIYPSIGIQFTNLIFPNLDLIVGPNPQHPVFGYHYFGQFAFVFSFILGLVTARMQARFYFRGHSTFLSGLFAFLLYFTMVSISVDFEYTLSKLASMIIGLTICVGPVLLIRPSTTLVRWIRRVPKLAPPKTAPTA